VYLKCHSLKKLGAGAATSGKDIIMKRIQSFGVAAFLAVASVVGLSGCAGDRYHESTGESIDDTATTARVKDTLDHDTIYKYPDVHVTTFKGEVQLSGFVDSGDQKSRAVTLAKSANGVKKVADNLTVK